MKLPSSTNCDTPAKKIASAIMAARKSPPKSISKKVK